MRDFDGMQELKQEEIDAVNGGVAWLALAPAFGVAGLVVAVGVGIYIGYKAAAE